MTTPIYVVGYPRSGNSYTAQLFADTLNCPVGRYRDALPLSAEGADRPAPYVVHQLHLHVEHGCDDQHSSAIPNAWTFCAENYKDEKIIYVQRDPRDVVVSIKHHWGFDTIADTILEMKNAENRLKMLGPYHVFVTQWLDWMNANPKAPWCMSIYEAMLTQPAVILVTGLIRMKILEKEHLGRMEGAIERQSFEVKKAQIEIDGETRPYGLGVQRQHLRKGIIGDWRNEFTVKDCQLFEKEFGDFTRYLRYTTDDKWWEEAVK